jgi:hypothetical protein
MMTRTTPTNNTETSEPKRGTDNFDRLLKVLERNAVNAQEPELVARLRAALRTIKGGDHA